MVSEVCAGRYGPRRVGGRKHERDGKSCGPIRISAAEGMAEEEVTISVAELLAEAPAP
jgi:hypothetical protein